MKPIAAKKKSYAQRAFERERLIKKAFIVAVYQDLERKSVKDGDPSVHPSQLKSGLIERMARNIRNRMRATELDAYKRFVAEAERRAEYINGIGITK